MKTMDKGQTFSPVHEEHDDELMIPVINVSIVGLPGWIACQNLRDVEGALQCAGLEDDLWLDWDEGDKVILTFGRMSKEEFENLEPFEGW